MKRIAQFEKVSFDQYANDMLVNEAFKNIDKDTLMEIYNDIKLPKRATSGSAGYDFFLPLSVHIKTKDELLIPTGIRVRITEGWVLSCYPRSGLGYKYKLGLANTVGIIDSDYYNALNEGHIILKFVNNGCEDVFLEKGKGVAQGVFTEYGITIDDDVTKERQGGFGSTN